MRKTTQPRTSILAILLAIVLLAPLAAQADPLKEVDLASDTDWTLSIDGGAKRPIKVPAGGYASELQNPIIVTDDVKDYATYERKITIPNVSPTQVTRLEFGAVNYAFDLFLDGMQVPRPWRRPR